MAQRTLDNLRLKTLFESLAFISQAALPLAEGLGVLSQNSRRSQAELFYSRLEEYIKAGSPLSQALAESQVVPTFAVNLLKMGENTGRVDQTLSGLAHYYGRRDSLAGALRGALVYPLSMLVVVLVVLFVLLSQALPVFQDVFAQLGLDLSGPALALMGFGNLLGHIASWLALAVLVIVVVVVLLALSKPGKRFFAWLFQTLPGLREVSLQLSAERLAFALSTLLETGLTIDQAFDQAKALLGDRRARRVVEQMSLELEQGQDIFRIFKMSGLFSPDLLPLLAVGIKTGKLSNALAKMADQIDRQTESKIASLIAVIEPLLVVVMCVLVAVVLLSVMLPLVGVLAGI
ncbi:MAG: type II secretion system F family protein [Coriobacteriales bacterium]|jgi:type IV pilus assembly protein PilC|nr:type II secretion system F family protein [Coriobacteriales bacterium]